MEVDSYTVLSGRKGENAIDDNLADGKQGASEFSESHNGFIEGNPRSAENSSLAEQESLDGTIVMDITSNLSHGEIARTNVLNTDDSKDMIISVEHLRETAHENADMQLPLHPPGLETKRHDQRHSTSSSKVYDNLDSSPQRPGHKKPNDMLSSPATGDHSEPAIISPCKVPARDENSYDMVSSSEFSASKEPSLESTNSNDDYVIVDDIRGDAASVSTYRHYRRNLSEAPEHKKLDELRIGLLELIYSALVNLADTAVDSVVGEVLKVEFFLCFVNHPASRIRTLSIEVG